MEIGVISTEGTSSMITDSIVMIDVEAHMIHSSGEVWALDDGHRGRVGDHTCNAHDAAISPTC